MPLDVPSGSTCVVDANILTYFLINSPPFTSHVHSFMHRVATGDVRAAATSIGVSEALHRVMLAEILHLFPTAGKPLAYVQRRPDVIEQLRIYPQAASIWQSIGLAVVDVAMPQWIRAGQLAVQHHLLTNDAATVAVMERDGIAHLVTNDDDFDSVPGIDVHKPR